MVDAFNAAMDDYMLFSGEPVGRLLSTAEVDPDFAMGYCLTGCLRLFGGVGPTHPRVSLELRAARARRTNKPILMSSKLPPPASSPKQAACGTKSCANIRTT
jgi:hypothetical protein